MKKLFAILMSIMMIACFMPTMAFAVGETTAIVTSDQIAVSGSFASENAGAIETGAVTFKSAEYTTAPVSLNVTVENKKDEEITGLSVSVADADGEVDNKDEGVCFDYTNPNSDTLAAANAEGGTKSTTFTVTPKENRTVGTHKATVKINKGTETKTLLASFTVTYVVTAKKIDTPTATDKEYNGQEQSGVAEGTGYTLSDDTSKTNVGTYSVKATLEPNYQWENESMDELNLSWQITAKKITVAAGTYQVTKEYDGTATVGENDAQGELACDGIIDRDKESVKIVPTIPQSYTTADVHTEQMNIGIALNDAEASGNYAIKDSATTIKVPCSITKKTVDGKTAATSAKYGTAGSINLSDKIVTGGTIGNITIEENKSDWFTVTPSVTDRTLNFSLANTEENKDKAVTVTIPVTSNNYANYNIVVTIHVTAKTVPQVTAPKAIGNLVYSGEAMALITAGQTTGADLQYKVASVKDEQETEVVAYSTQIPKVTNAGKYKVYYKAEANAECEAVAEKFITVTIAKKSIAKPAQAEAVVYSGKAQTYAVVSTNEYTVTSAAQTNANTDGYDVTIALADKDNTMWAGGTTDDLTQKFIIKKAPKIEVAASAKKIYVNGQVPVLTSPVVDKDYTVAGLLGSDKLGGTIALAYQKDGIAATPDNKVVGAYDIVISGATAPEGNNYEGIEFKNATLTIASQSFSGSSGGSYYPYTPSTPSKPAAPNLDKTKTDSTTAINAAATANKYDAAEQAEVKKILDKANADIKNAKTEAEVKAIEEAAQAEIDKILTTEEKAIVAALDNVEKRDFATKSKVITRKGGKKVIRLTWTAPDGVDVDGYEIFRSTKKNSGFGKKPYFTTSNTSYTNTKALKAGKTYYYKVRAFVVINGERVYTDYSLKANRKL